MKRLKGPELKMPELKAPGFLADFYYDLRDRRLLPVLALVLVAIVATPILLGQKSETTLPPAASEAVQALGESQGRKSASFTVVEATPGLRDYHKRLRRRKPLDPFRSMGKPNLEGARLGGGEGGGGGEETSSGGGSASLTSTSTTKETKNSKTTTTKTTTTGSGEGSEGGSGAAEGPGGGGSGGSAPPKHATLFSFAVDVTIVHNKVGKGVGEQQADKPEKLTKVLPTTPLPDQKTQVITYMGLSPKTRKPLFIVSPEVASVFGEGKCAAGLGTCQLIELEPGFPETFEFESGDQYTVKVTNVEYVVVGHS